MSRLYVDRLQANTTDGDVMLETNLIVSGTSGDRTIQIDNNAANSANLQIIAPAGSPRIDFHLDKALGNTAQMSFKAQRVGINQPDPQHTLDVNGDARVTGNLIVSGTLDAHVQDFKVTADTMTFGDASGDTLTFNASTAATPNGLNFDSNTLVIDASNNRVGIGAASPSSTLELEASSGDLVLEMDHNQTNGTNFQIQNGESNRRIDFVVNSLSDGNPASMVDTILTMYSQRIGIGNTSPAHTLDVSGNARVTTDLLVGDDLSLNSDAAVLNFGADSDVSLTHVADTGLLLNGTMKIQFNDASQFIQGSSATVLALGATDEISLTATAVTITGALATSGVLSLPDGSASAPALTNTGDTNCGLFFSAADTLAFTAGGTSQFTMADGVVAPVADSDVDLGTSSLYWKDAYIDDVYVSGEVKTANIGYTDGDNAITIADGGAITAAAGITSTAAANSLGATSFNDANITNVGDIALDSISSDAGTSISITLGTDAGDDLIVATNKLVVEGDTGRVGIGTATPSSSLEIESSSGDQIFEMDNNASNSANFQIQNGAGNSRVDLVMNDGSANTTVTLKGQKVGILDTDPSYTLDVNGTGQFTSDLIVGGNLTVSGTTTTVNTANVTVEDPLLLLASGQSGTPSVDAGLIIERGSSTNVTMIWDESADEFAFATTTSAADTAGNVSIAAYASLQVNALTAGSLDISGNADIDGTLEADAITVNGTTLAEVISDTAGAMFSSNTETGITATYQDGDNTIDLALDAAQTTITSLLATDIKIGEDDETKIDFETANEIHFYANNVEQVYLADNIFGPQSDSDVDLGSTTVRWKDAYIDSITTTGNVNAGGNVATTGNLTVAGTTTLSDNVKIIDDKTLTFGTDDDWTIEYDENGDDDLVMTGTTLSVVTDTATFTSANSADPVVVIKNTANDTGGPRLQLVKDKGAAGAANDVNGLIQFVGDDANQDQVMFSQIMSQVKVATNGQEGGKLTVSVAENDGTLTAGLVIEDGDADGELDATIGAGTSSVVTTAGNLKVTGNIIQNSEGTTTITMDTSENITVAGGVVAGAASTFNADVSLGENNITNVGDINCDSISVDGAATGLNLDFSGANTGTGKITLADNLASAVVVTESSNAYVTFVTSDGAEKVQFSQDILVDKTADTCDAASSGVGATQAAVTMNGTRRGTITVTTDQAIANSGTNAFLGIAVTADHVLETDSISVSTGMMRDSGGNNLTTSATKAYAINQVDGAFVILIDGLGNGTSVGGADSTIKVNWVAL